MTLEHALIVLAALTASELPSSEALALMQAEVARLQALRGERNLAHFVIRYTDGAYNRNQGFTATLDEASLYADRQTAQDVAQTLDLVEDVYTLAQAMALDAAEAA